MAAKKTGKRAGARALPAGKKKKKVVRIAPPSRKVAAKPSPKVAAKPSPKVAAKPLEAAVPSAGVTDGDSAPSFELLDQAGDSLSSADLEGKPYVLYFYPKDDTPGCTTEACAFRDALPDFKKLGVRVIGVSPDSSSSHERFVAKYSLPFTLLSDPDKTLSAAYGVWAKKTNYGREYMGVVRSTFLVDADGVVQKVWRSVKVKGHVEQVQTAAAALS
jgi:peroxiredoxin Q/BCP